MQDLTLHLLKTFSLSLHSTVFVSFLVEVLELLWLQLAGHIRHPLDLRIANAHWRGLPQLELPKTTLTSTLLLALRFFHSRINLSQLISQAARLLSGLHLWDLH